MKRLIVLVVAASCWAMEKDIEKIAPVPFPAPPMSSALQQHIQRIAEEDIMSDQLTHYLLGVASPRVKRALSPIFSEVLIQSHLDNRKVWGILRSLNDIIEGKDPDNHLSDLKTVLAHTVERYIKKKDLELYELSCARDYAERRRWRYFKISCALTATWLVTLGMGVAGTVWYSYQGGES